jgi:Xaa-Pro aminopeptidase
VAQIRKASAISRAALMRVANSLEPGIHEFELEAELTAGIIAGGARGHAFEPILASGKNALVLHYNENSSLCKAGDLLLMDFGAEINNYASDCTRTLPVSGKFSRRQREVYNAVYRIFQQARAMMVTGQLLDELNNQVGALWEEEHIRLGLYKKQGTSSRAGSEPLWKKYSVHGTSHSLGLDVHDPYDRSEPFQEGMIFTCEPAIYIPEEGIGIRLENDILITGSGPVDLMEDIPLEAGEIEEMMQKRQRYD